MSDKTHINFPTTKIIIYIVLAIATTMVYWQVNQYNFVNIDDDIYVTANSHVQSGITFDGVRWAFSTLWDKYRQEYWIPLTWLSLMLDYQLFGLKAGGYHVTNLILHVISTLLLFWLFCRMTKAVWRSAFVAALFALHPLHVESVVWVTERKDVLSAFFWIMTICLYVYYTEKPVIQRYGLVLFSFVLALLSKPMVVTLPLVLMLLDYWPLNRLTLRKNATKGVEKITATSNKWGKKSKTRHEASKKNISPANMLKLSEPMIAGWIPLWQIREKTPFFILSAIFSAITICAQIDPTRKKFPLSSRLLNAPVSFMTYLEKTLWPHDMAVYYPFSTQLPVWQALIASLLIMAISIAVIVLIKRFPYLFVGWLWYIIALLPVIGIVQSGNQAMADRYTYLALIGISIMMAWGVPALFAHQEKVPKILFAAIGAVLMIMAAVTWKQSGYWKDSITLFSHALQVTKNNDQAHNNLGAALYDEGKIREAIDHYSEAIRIKPDNESYFSNRGNAYARLNKYEQAVEEYNEAIRLKPDYVLAFYHRGMAYGQLGRNQQAIEDYDQAIRLKPDFFRAYLNRGNTYNVLGQTESALDDFSTVIKLEPNFPGAYHNRAFVYLKQGNKKYGCPDAQRACELGNCTILKLAKEQRLCL